MGISDTCANSERLSACTSSELVFTNIDATVAPHIADVVNATK